MVLPIVLEVNPNQTTLRKKAKKVRVVDSLIRQLMNDMLETMYAKNGIGLAANQVGVLKRIIVADLRDGKGPLRLVNPKVVSKSEELTKYTEECLSVPGFVGIVERHQKVVVQALDEKGKKIVITAAGLWAIVLQHEIDHLEGILYTDKVEILQVLNDRTPQ